MNDADAKFEAALEHALCVQASFSVGEATAQDRDTAQEAVRTAHRAAIEALRKDGIVAWLRVDELMKENERLRKERLDE